MDDPPATLRVKTAKSIDENANFGPDSKQTDALASRLPPNGSILVVSNHGGSVMKTSSPSPRGISNPCLYLNPSNPSLPIQLVGPCDVSKMPDGTLSSSHDLPVPSVAERILDMGEPLDFTTCKGKTERKQNCTGDELAVQSSFNGLDEVRGMNTSQTDNYLHQSPVRKSLNNNPVPTESVIRFPTTEPSEFKTRPYYDGNDSRPKPGRNKRDAMNDVQNIFPSECGEVISVVKRMKYANDIHAEVFSFPDAQKQNEAVSTRKLSAEEAKRIRRVKNRASVEKCRTKQRLRTEALQSELKTLEHENKTLRDVTAWMDSNINNISSQITVTGFDTQKKKLDSQ